MTNAWSVRSLLCYAANLNKGGKPGFGTGISLLRAVHHFPNRKTVPQNVGNVAIELAQFKDHFDLVPEGPYEATSDSDVLVHIRRTPEILAYLTELRLSIEKQPTTSWAKAPDAAVPYASDAAPLSGVPLPRDGPSPAPGLAAGAWTAGENVGGGDVTMTDAGASLDAANAAGKGKGKSDSGPRAGGSWSASSNSGTNNAQWGYGNSTSGGQWQEWGSSQPATGTWTKSQQESGDWRKRQYGGDKAK